MDNLKRIAKRFFQYEARLVLRKYNPKIIAISGSVGKTLTKEAIYLVMSKKFYVRKSEKSFTTELGVPLAIIGCHDAKGIAQWITNILLGLKLYFFRSKYPEWLILEIDTDKPGDLQSISSYLHPDILVMTAVGDVPAHFEAFYEMENFTFEKKHLIQSVKRDGIIIYNADDARTANLVEESLVRSIPIGLASDCEVIGSEYEVLYGAGKSPIPTGMTFEIKYNDEKFPIKIFQSVGVHNEYACLLAFMVGIEMKLEPKEISQYLNKFRAMPGRMNMVNGIKNSLIMDDSYNASPVATEASIIAFTSLASYGKRIVVLGDMLELGRYSAIEHKKISEMLNHSMTDVLTVGIRTRKIASELLEMGFDESHLFSFDTSVDAGKELQRILAPNDLVLVKGSQAMRMERVVEEVMRHPEDKNKILVRQEEEWKGR